MYSRIFGFICLWSILLGFVSLADAGPYSVVARYGRDRAKLTLLPDLEVPDNAKDNGLEDIAIVFDSKPFGLFPSQAFESFKVDVKVQGESCASTSLVLSQLENGGVFPVCKWRHSRAQEQDPVRVSVEVRARLSQDMMCAIESLYRERNGKNRPELDKKKRRSRVSGGSPTSRVRATA